LKGNRCFQAVYALAQGFLEMTAAADQVFLLIQIVADCLTNEVGFGDIAGLLADELRQPVAHCGGHRQTAAD